MKEKEGRACKCLVRSWEGGGMDRGLWHGGRGQVETTPCSPKKKEKTEHPYTEKIGEMESGKWEAK